MSLCPFGPFWFVVISELAPIMLSVMRAFLIVIAFIFFPSSSASRAVPACVDRRGNPPVFSRASRVWSFRAMVCSNSATGALSMQDVPDAELTETEKRMKAVVLPKTEVVA